MHGRSGDIRGAVGQDPLRKVPVLSPWTLLLISGTAFHWIWMAKIGDHVYCVVCLQVFGSVVVMSCGDPWYWNVRSQSPKCCTTFAVIVRILNDELVRVVESKKLNESIRSVSRI